MTARQCSATDHGLRLVEAGMPLRTAAKTAGVAVSTLVRARARLGLGPLRRGRPPMRKVLCTPMTADDAARLMAKVG